jgi:hypothetical protein
MLEIPADAADLLSLEAIENWTTSGARFAENVPDDIAFLRKWARELRREGRGEIQIACASARMFRLAREEHLGLVEFRDLPDGSAVTVGRDPFEGLPTTDEP